MISGGANISTYLSDPKVKAFLDLIARAEGTYQVGDNGYNILYGFGTFQDYSKHPNKAVTKGGLTSTAAGRYQFLKKTWDSVKSATGLNDFSPAAQDLGAIELLKRRGALPYIVSGDIQTAITKSNKEWASFPGSPYGQGTRSMNTMLNWYNADLKKYGGSSGTAWGATKIAEDLSNNSSWLNADFNTAGVSAAGAVLIIGAIAGLIYYYKS